MYIPAMKTNIPKVWQQMKAGEQVYSRRPFHALQSMAVAAKAAGIHVRFDPAPNGYWVIVDKVTKPRKQA